MKIIRGICFILIGAIIMCSNIIHVYAMSGQDNVSTEITTDIDLKQSKKQFNGTVFIKFYDTTLYNENVKLSYHIYDLHDNILIFENERLPFMPVNGTAEVKVSIDLNSIEQLANQKNYIIRFDLVDEQNIYWYRDNPNIHLKTIDINYSETFLTKIAEKYGFVVRNQLIQLIFSMVFIAAIYIIFQKNRINNVSKRSKV